jgi:hypothetical protein
VLRVTTLKGAGTAVANLIDYYAGLAEDQQRRDGTSRGPVDYYLDPDDSIPRAARKVVSALISACSARTSP